MSRRRRRPRSSRCCSPSTLTLSRWPSQTRARSSSSPSSTCLTSGAKPASWRAASSLRSDSLSHLPRRRHWLKPFHRRPAKRRQGREVELRHPRGVPENDEMLTSATGGNVEVIALVLHPFRTSRGNTRCDHRTEVDDVSLAPWKRCAVAPVKSTNARTSSVNRRRARCHTSSA